MSNHESVFKIWEKFDSIDNVLKLKTLNSEQKQNSQKFDSWSNEELAN